MQIEAAVTEGKGLPFSIQTVDVGELRDDEILVKVAAVGICHTDLIVRDQWYPVPLPAVLGHEGAGVVVQVGATVTTVAPGDRVAMSFHSCGHCRSCRRGSPSYCLSFFAHNFAASRPVDESSILSRHGEPLHAHFFGQSSFATHAVANERNVVRIQGDIPLTVAAPFGCGVQTGAGGVLNALRPPAGSAIAIFGTGAVGLSAVMAAGIAGCTTIIGIDLNTERLSLARELGATHVIDAARANAGEAIVELTGGGVDYSMETTGAPAVFRQAVDCLAPMGTCGLIGAPAFGTEVSLDMNAILVGGRTVRGIVEGDSVPQIFLPTLVRFWEQGRFPVERLTRAYDFEQIDEAAADAGAGRTIKPVLRLG